MKLYLIIAAVAISCLVLKVSTLSVACGPCPQSYGNCNSGVMDRDYCGCNVCVEGTRKLGEQCGDVLGPGGKCDVRERLLCSYPQDQSIMTGVCIEGVNTLEVAAPAPKKPSLLRRWFTKIKNIFK